jgi:hypothetical protein
MYLLCINRGTNKVCFTQGVLSNKVTYVNFGSYQRFWGANKVGDRPGFIFIR